MQNDQILALSFFVILALLALACLYRRKWRGSGTAFGTAAWMQDRFMRAAGYFKEGGLVVGRTFSGNLIWVKDYCHLLLVGGTGSGKGVSVIIPNLLTYFRGSIICFDTKGDLYETAAGRRAARGERIIRLAPFNGGRDAFNPLDTIPRDSPRLVDDAKALAESIVVRQGTETDPYWNDKSAQVIQAVLVLVLLTFTGADRSLISVQSIISDPDLLWAASVNLQKLGGVPARLGSQLKSLFAKEEKE